MPDSIYPTKELDDKPDDMKAHSMDELKEVYDEFIGERAAEVGVIPDNVMALHPANGTQPKRDPLVVQEELGAKLVNLLEKITNLTLDAWKPYIKDRIAATLYEDMEYIIANAKDVVRLMEETQEVSIFRD